jgi:hypothetical protein
MQLSEYDFATFYIVYSLVSWIIDFLSDSKITDNEIKIGMLQYIHHLVSISHIGIIVLLFFSKSMNMAIYSIIISMIVQVGWLINNDNCWYTTMVNKMIDPKQPNRKWRGEIGSFIKHYVRGDSWAYSDIYNTNMSTPAHITNVATIMYLLKVIYF